MRSLIFSTSSTSSLTFVGSCSSITSLSAHMHLLGTEFDLAEGTQRDGFRFETWVRRR